MNCPHCAAPIRTEARFCSACGNPLAEPTDAVAVDDEQEGATAVPRNAGSRWLLVAVSAAGAVLAVIVLVILRPGGGAEQSRSTSPSARGDTGTTQSEDGDRSVLAPESTSELVLSGNGFESIPFGTPAHEALERLTELLGQPRSDEPGPDPGLCPDRYVTWEAISVYFDEESSSGVEHFAGWSMDALNGGSGTADDLRTATGLGLGSTAAEIEQLTADFDYFEGDPVGTPPFGPIQPSYTIDSMSFVMTGDGPSAVVDQMFSGFTGCGE